MPWMDGSLTHVRILSGESLGEKKVSPIRGTQKPKWSKAVKFKIGTPFKTFQSVVALCDQVVFDQTRGLSSPGRTVAFHPPPAAPPLRPPA